MDRWAEKRPQQQTHHSKDPPCLVFSYSAMFAQEATGSAIHAAPAEYPLLITPSDASQTATNHFVSKMPPDILEPGSGELNQPATWDEFPNGRFGDSKSPAFQVGAQDPWNAGGLNISVSHDRLSMMSTWLMSHEYISATAHSRNGAIQSPSVISQSFS